MICKHLYAQSYVLGVVNFKKLAHLKHSNILYQLILYHKRWLRISYLHQEKK